MTLSAAMPPDLRSDQALLHYISSEDPQEAEALFAAARELRSSHYGQDVYFRGLIEFSNYCRNNCYYCGIRGGNPRVERYRLSLEEILRCCRLGDLLGYRTFVFQSGEDPWFTEGRIVEMVEAVRKEFPDHAITLSIGEWGRESYEHFFRAGANRYLLRHETASEEHYRKLHPREMSLRERKQCLWDLKDIGYQVGAGFMVGTPFQTPENLLEDLRFLQELEPHMVGIGPFIPQADTPFRDYPRGSFEQTLRMVALTRLLLPRALIPATTALGTISPLGREKGLMAGANVVMPNLSPKAVRKLYALYDHKICTGDEAAECRLCMEGRIRHFGFEPNMARGDMAGWEQRKVPANAG
ncbi:[FeFe] hydrogenase H-cluster radical SAM maturase HydE [Treponema sp. TIM-1]|uniref:[FeFe] hydrogenase H-cluster radical SAM maturase HydE n=1 Tax=Treponema sp. TIM-1 TaxID=2898417 RepID=UPI003980A534